MKSIMKFLGVALLAVFVFTSCSKDDNPADNLIFAGTYTGTTSYTGVPAASGKVLVTKVGDTYNFDFKDNGTIPSISGVKLEKGDGGYIGTVNGYTGVIRFNANNLNIAVTKDGKSWGADCNR